MDRQMLDREYQSACRACDVAERLVATLQKAMEDAIDLQRRAAARLSDAQIALEVAE